MTCPEKREEPYYGIYLFEMYRHIFSLLSYWFKQYLFRKTKKYSAVVPTNIFEVIK